MKLLLCTIAIVVVGMSAHWLFDFPVTDMFDVVRHNLPEIGPPADAEAQPPHVVTWQTLRELDYQTRQQSPAIAQLVSDGVTVRVPGFMVPLEDTADAVTEFFLTPYVIACVHVPPPPPNQMIHVKMVRSKKQKVIWDPVWVQGRLQVVETASPYGAAAYTMTGVLVEPY